MTKTLKTLAAVLALTAAFATAPAQAMPIWNGVQLNGMKSNGLQLNGMCWNGMHLNGMGWNGMRSNGFVMNGFVLNGVKPNGTATTGTQVQLHQIVAVTLPGSNSTAAPAIWVCTPTAANTCE